MKFRISTKVLAIIGIFLVGTGIGVGSMFLKEKLFPSGEPTTTVEVKKVDEIGPLLDLGEFIINLKGGGILKAEITVEGINAKSLDKLKAKEVFLRDKVITVFAAKELKNIIAVEERDSLKQELVMQLNQVSKDEVKDVLFKSFVYSF